MKIKHIAAAISLSCLICLASAQSYHIQTVHHTNLRTSGSLSASIVTIVKPGTTLHVVGSLDRWLRIIRNGREVWMAEWVDHTRVDGSGIPSDVDNCCFIDQQCRSDQDWLNGYFAYQNQQCPAPGQFGNKHGLSIIGGAGFISQVEESLDVLKNRAPHWYNYTIGGLARIVQLPQSEVPGMDVRARTFYLNYPNENPPGFTRWQHISNTAAMLSHEACHTHRYLEGLEPGGYPGEKACLTLQIEVLKAINAPGFLITSYQHVLDNIDDPEYQWWLPGNY